MIGKWVVDRWEYQDYRRVQFSIRLCYDYDDGESAREDISAD